MKLHTHKDYLCYDEITRSVSREKRVACTLVAFMDYYGTSGSLTPIEHATHAAIGTPLPIVLQDGTCMYRTGTDGRSQLYRVTGTGTRVRTVPVSTVPGTGSYLSSINCTGTTLCLKIAQDPTAW